ncbi:hypothetical protein D3C81_2221530 [compost metagenome]
MLEKKRVGGRIGRVVAHVAHESDDAADTGPRAVAQRGGQRGAVEIGFLDADHGFTLR